jgi:hypothetical protein
LTNILLTLIRTLLKGFYKTITALAKNLYDKVIVTDRIRLILYPAFLNTEGINFQRCIVNFMEFKNSFF